VAAYRVNLHKVRSCRPNRANLVVTTLHQGAQITPFFHSENLCFQVQCSSAAYTGSSELQLHLRPVDIIVVDSDGLTGIQRIE